MASVKISDLPAASQINSDDTVPIVQGGTTKKAVLSLPLSLGTITATDNAGGVGLDTSGHILSYKTHPGGGGQTHTTVDWHDQQLFDDGLLSLDWKNRYLYAVDTTTVLLDWNGSGGNGIAIPNGAIFAPKTINTLPTAIVGTVASISDGDSGLTWGATAVNSGSGATTYLVWYNGAAWTVIGK